MEVLLARIHCADKLPFRFIMLALLNFLFLDLDCTNRFVLGWRYFFYLWPGVHHNGSLCSPPHTHYHREHLILFIASLQYLSFFRDFKGY